MNKKSNLLVNLIFVLFCLCCIIPFVMLISISFSNEMEILRSGYGVLPKKFDLTAYKYIFENPSMIVDGYIVTILYASVGTVVSVILMSLAAYSLSSNGLRGKKFYTYYIFFTMLFSGGLVPSYIVNTQLLGLKDSMFVYLFIGLINPWHIFLMRTFFKGLPDGLTEAAHIDGASEFKIYISIVMPLSKPVLATVALFGVLTRWNDWNTSLLYIDNEKLYTLQYLLQRILMDVESLQENMTKMPSSVYESQLNNIPGETIRMAMAVLAAGPMVIAFPFFQKYFTRGLTIGAIKG